MTCSACGTDNRVGAKFCTECGAAFGGTCPSCGGAVEAGANFCPECGTRVTGSVEPVATRSSPEPATERRLVSVLFADLVGFTTFAEGRDSEAVRDLLSAYFDRASEVVARYGGTVEKFIGDAVMAVWGTPVAHEDDAERSVRAALDLVQMVRTLGEEMGWGSLRARAGVMTGEAAVTIGALNQGMVAGDLVNTASRLQSIADPGTVLVGETTKQATEGAIAFEPAGRHELKGKVESVAAFRALRVVATVGGAIRTEALEPPFVGRDVEFRLLREVFHNTGRERRARLVSLIGQGGIGKSRLAWELEKYLDGLRQAIWWHEGRSPAYGDGVTFWALGEMVRKRAGLAEGDDETTARERIALAVAEHLPDQEERAFVEPTLLALLGLDEPPPGGRDRLFSGWRLFLERLSATSTVVLLFEDLQWADDGLLDFIEHVLEWSRSYPILIVTLARPELLDRRPTWAATRSASSLALGPLADDEMRELLAGLVPGLPEPAVRSVLGRADGVPLYAVETVRMLVADGRLEPDGDGHFRPTGRLDSVEVPATLQALIAARLDTLDASNRTLLQDASVLGQTFTIEALAAITGVESEDLVPRLRSLVGRELLLVDTDPASPERGQYVFVQALIREVAYSTLAKRDRRARHVAAARYYEAFGESELAPVLASHYLDAYRASPEGAEAQAVGAQARIALRAAADRAMALGSYLSAATYLEQALELGAADPTDEAELLERSGRAANLGGQYERADPLLARAIERWREVGDGARAGEAVALRGLALTDAGYVDRALAYLQGELPEVERSGGDVARASILARIAHAHVRKGSDDALTAVEEVFPVLERHQLIEPILDALITKAAALDQVGRSIEGSILVEGVLRRAGELGMRVVESRASANAVVQMIEIAPRRAFELGLETVERARTYGDRSNLVLGVTNTAEIAARLGEWETIEALLEPLESLQLERLDRMLVRAARRRLDLLRGGPTEGMLENIDEMEGTGTVAASWTVAELTSLAAGLQQDFETVYRQTWPSAAADLLNAPTLYERAGRAALWLGDADRAREVIDAFAALGRTAPMPATQLAGLVAGLAALEGRRAEALGLYRDALQRLRELRLDLDLAVLSLDAARFLGIDTPEAAAPAAEARAIFERLGATPYLAILDSLSAGATAAPSFPEETEVATA